MIINGKKDGSGEIIFTDKEIEILNKNKKLELSPKFLKHFANLFMALFVNIQHNFDDKTKKILKTCDIEEGDFIIFPAYLLHRSPKNKTNSKKTIFSLNLDFLKKDENI